MTWHLGSVLAVAGALCGGASIARAEMVPESAGPRVVATGDALGAAAYGSAAKNLNPAGIVLMKSYVIEASYGFRPGGDAAIASLSICDSTRKVGACLSYDYVSSSPSDMLDRRLHLLSLSTAFPIGDKVFLGTTQRFADFDEKVGNLMTDASRNWAFLFDAGMIVKVTPSIHLAVVAQNLIGNDDRQFPRKYGGGFAFLPTPEFVIAGDARFTPLTESARWAAGAEYYLRAGEQLYPIRLGYAYDGDGDRQYLTGGLGWVSPRFGIDAALRRQVAQGDETTLLIGVRLFMAN